MSNTPISIIENRIISRIVGVKAFKGPLKLEKKEENLIKDLQQIPIIFIPHTEAQYFIIIQNIKNKIIIIRREINGYRARHAYPWYAITYLGEK